MYRIVALLFPIAVGVFVGQFNALVGLAIGLVLFCIIPSSVIGHKQKIKEARRLAEIPPITVMVSKEEAERLKDRGLRAPDPPDPLP